MYLGCIRRIVIIVFLLTGETGNIVSSLHRWDGDKCILEVRDNYILVAPEGQWQ